MDGHAALPRQWASRQTWHGRSCCCSWRRMEVNARHNRPPAAGRTWGLAYTVVTVGTSTAFGASGAGCSTNMGAGRQCCVKVASLRAVLPPQRANCTQCTVQELMHTSPSLDQTHRLSSGAAAQRQRLGAVLGEAPVDDEDEVEDERQDGAGEHGAQVRLDVAAAEGRFERQVSRCIK